MSKRYLKIAEYLLFLFLLIWVFSRFLPAKRQDTEFCRDIIFSGLIKGQGAVAKYIDWENLTALGADAGVEYLKLPNSKEREDFQRAFINGFALGFLYDGGNPDNFTDWRPYKQDKDSVTVAADYKAKKKILLFTLSKESKKGKLKALAWQEMK
jgi:hypothetical protein